MDLPAHAAAPPREDPAEVSGRRAFLGKTLAVTAGLAGATVAAGATAAPAHASSLRPQATQTYWRFCSKCYGMFYWGYSGNGVCPAGADHLAQGYNFVLPHDVVETPTAQAYWRFCSKCYGMFYWGYSTRGRCPAGADHLAQGYNFVLPHS
ncbi:hypothetical protein [Actinacidiphila paucisporea]|uniref:Uncharacterized protein n=1 Tax=Actinacidiphila paucisporea TaxID=310782 RepID=A0A1M7QNW2_9ACTN|nr:hypothetical protein [Actinacidiphila paucisporea]SHN32803.1 hypothetical protein SAMN05216499_13835 [Actinacidiphila paucisporea]